MLRLREVVEADLGVLFAHQRDPEAIQMAAFTVADPEDKQAFEERWRRLLADPSVFVRVIESRGATLGHIASFDEDGVREVTYWIARDWWGRGIASASLAAFLALERARPLYARVAADNVGSRRVLEKNGFGELARSPAFANARAGEIQEIVLQLACS